MERERQKQIFLQIQSLLKKRQETTCYLNLFLTGRRRIGRDLGSARREKIPHLLLQITDPMRQSEIIGPEGAERCEGFALSKHDNLRRVGCHGQQPCQVASPRSHHEFPVHFQDSKRTIAPSSIINRIGKNRLFFQLKKEKRQKKATLCISKSRWMEIKGRDDEMRNRGGRRGGKCVGVMRSRRCNQRGYSADFRPSFTQR